MKKLLALSLSILSVSFSFAQHAQVSTEPHRGAVVVIHPKAGTDSFYSAGEDGFLTQWSQDGVGDHFQVTDLRITGVASSPNGKDVAVAATDGASIHRVEVMDWATSARKYTKQFKEPVISVTYSPKGTYLFISTNEVQGNYILNADTGKLYKKVDLLSRIGYTYVAESEKNAIFYTPSDGQLIYYNLLKMQAMSTKFFTEKQLTQVRSFGVGEKSKGRFLAGIKQDRLYIVDAMSGKVLFNASLKAPLIVDSADRSAIYFTSSDSSVSLGKVLEKDLLAKVEDPTATVAVQPVASFPEIPVKKLCSASLMNELSVMFGMNDGTVYEARKAESGYSVRQVTSQMYDRILDVQSFDEKVYMLTSSGLYVTTFDESGEKDIRLVAKNAGQTNLIVIDASTAILWSQKSRNAFQKVSISGESIASPVNVMTPSASVQTARVFGRNLVYTLSNSKVERYNLDTGKRLQVYSGNAVQDAALITDSMLYVSKASASGMDSPVVMKSLNSGETASIKVDGSISYAVTGDSSEEKNVYGLVMKDISGTVISQVFQYFPSQRKSRVILSYNQEDQDAFVKVVGNTLYTNLGKNQVYAYDIETGLVKVYRRTSSLPRKIACTADRIAFLNDDGGISWYNPLSQTAISQWYLGVDGKWIEF